MSNMKHEPHIPVARDCSTGRGPVEGRGSLNFLFAAIHSEFRRPHPHLAYSYNSVNGYPNVLRGPGGCAFARGADADQRSSIESDQLQRGHQRPAPVFHVYRVSTRGMGQYVLLYRTRCRRPTAMAARAPAHTPAAGLAGRPHEGLESV